MTDTKPTPSDASEQAAEPSPDQQQTAISLEERAGERRNALSRWLVAGLVVAVIVIVALAAALRHQQQQLDDFGREASRRLDTAAAHAQSAQQQAEQAQNMVQGFDRRLNELADLTRSTAEQQQALDQAWRELVVGQDESLLVDVEQSLLLAREQLHLAGRVPSAIAALQFIEARLAQNDRPMFRGVRQAVARDLKQLQALPFHDPSAVVEQIDDLIADVRRFPLVAPGLGEATPADAAAVQPAGADPSGSSHGTESASTPSAHAHTADSSADAQEEGQWWEQAWARSQAWAERTGESAWNELRRLVQVQRVESPDALMLSAEQGEILRANLELRLIEARMALLQQVNSLWQSDLTAVREAVAHYGEPGSPITRRLLSGLDELLALEPAPELPSLSGSLKAVRSLQVQIESNAPARPDALSIEG